jgi:hypothetical protein
VVVEPDRVNRMPFLRWVTAAVILRALFSERAARFGRKPLLPKDLRRVYLFLFFCVFTKDRGCNTSIYIV